MSELSKNRIVKILLVEDNLPDLRLIREALKDSGISNIIYAIRNGQEALDFLLKKGQYSDSPRPDIIILDLNLPLKNGFEVLQETKNNKSLNSIPVIVLTTSSSPADISKAYELNANSYINKPLEYDEFLDILQSFDKFWLQSAKLA